MYLRYKQFFKEYNLNDMMSRFEIGRDVKDKHNSVYKIIYIDQHPLYTYKTICVIEETITKETYLIDDGDENFIYIDIDTCKDIKVGDRVSPTGGSIHKSFDKHIGLPYMIVAKILTPDQADEIFGIRQYLYLLQNEKDPACFDYFYEGNFTRHIMTPEDFFKEIGIGE